MYFSIPCDLVGTAALSLAPSLSSLIRPEQVVFSMAAVRAIDASGVALLVRVRSHLARVGGQLSLTELSEPVLRELRRIGLDSLLCPPTRAPSSRLAVQSA